MATCFQCGEPKSDYRRTVYTGYSTGSWVSKRSYGSSTRTSYGVRTVCKNCAGQIDKSQLVKTSFYLTLLMLGLIYYIIVR